MKIAILGAAGGVGQALSLLLKNQLPSGSKLHLYDITIGISGIAKDLSHIPTNVTVVGFSADDIKPALHNVDIVLITAGISRKPGKYRSELFNINANIIYKLIENIAQQCPRALIGIITNPINTIVPLAAQVLKKYGTYDKNKLFGITTLDVIRANTFVAELKNKDPQEIEVKVIGGHSNETILPLLNQIKNIKLTEEEIKTLIARIQNAGTEVINSKAGNGSATLSTGQAAARFCLSLVDALNGKKNIIECSYVDSDNQYSKFFAQPILLGCDGIKERLPININTIDEKKQLEEILKKLKKEIESVNHFFE
ncbi:malate dehydrogenase [Arsenophonus symbiont of Ornithomya chloropus]|uniref:malate dehydrogenase n=1 Tax=Arsenophonus symbiont of Ornithomya chloropus TaxID=634121 RepID=UPI0032B277E1